MIELEFREENRRTRRKTLEAREGINKLNSHVTPSPGIEPEIAVVRGERLTATQPMHPQAHSHVVFTRSMFHYGYNLLF
jgi:hypothetical protein